MSIIQNISQALIDEHIPWHALPGNPVAGGRAINPWPPTGGGPAAGSGEEFLVFHQGFVQRFRDWVETLPANDRPAQASIESWKVIPPMLRMGMLGWNAALAQDELRLADMSNFSTLDELGRFLEWDIHGFLHNSAAGMWNEPVLLSYESPRSTYFWQLHGLIEMWREQWVENRETPVSPFVPLEVGGASTQAAIGTPGEIDRFEFLVPTPATHTVETSGPTDVVMFLAGPNDAQRLVTSDDDSGQGTNARIQRPLGAGTYFVYVIHYSEVGVGNYDISVTRN